MVVMSFSWGNGFYVDLLTGLSEEQIIEIFSSAGKVLNFRLVYDRETGKPKGFGFAEYPDAGEIVEFVFVPGS